MQNPGLFKTLRYSEQDSYSEPCQTSTMERLEKHLTATIFFASNHLFMSSSLWNRYNVFNVALNFTQEVFIQCNKVWVPWSRDGDYEFWYTFSKVYSDMNYYFWLSTFSNSSATHNPYITELFPLEYLEQIWRH